MDSQEVKLLTLEEQNLDREIARAKKNLDMAQKLYSFHEMKRDHMKSEFEGEQKKLADIGKIDNTMS